MQHVGQSSFTVEGFKKQVTALEREKRMRVVNSVLPS